MEKIINHDFFKKCNKKKWINILRIKIKNIKNWKLSFKKIIKAIKFFYLFNSQINFSINKKS